MYGQLLLAAVVPLTLAEYSYSYVARPPTGTPTASAAPTRTETYAPTRMTEAPSYAPTTDTYAPTYGSCPSLVFDVDAAKCPADATSLSLCNRVGLSAEDLCVTSGEICPGQPGPTNCRALQGARRPREGSRPGHPCVPRLDPAAPPGLRRRRR